MSAKHAFRRLLGLVLAIGLTGCASAYHAYPTGCCIPYSYCPPSPLPYTAYDQCHCPTPVATQWRQQNAAAQSPEKHTTRPSSWDK